MSDAKKQIHILKAKSPKLVAFHYADQKQDLEALINFVGKKPTIDFEKGELQIAFRKHKILEGSLVFRNSFGEVINVMTLAEAEKMYDIVQVREYSSTDKNIVQEKERKTK